MAALAERMANPSPGRLQACIRQWTRLEPVSDLPGVVLHTADDAMEVMRLTGQELDLPDPPLPFWAFPWPGGLAIARYLVDDPAAVAGRRILDLATGSGLCAIVAMRAGASDVVAADVDPFAQAAVALNARANHVRVRTIGGDVLDSPPPSCDVILAGDVCYEETMAARTLTWLRLAAAGGARVLLGDPGRAYLPRDLEQIATYRVRASREIGDPEPSETSVFTIAPG